MQARMQWLRMIRLGKACPIQVVQVTGISQSSGIATMGESIVASTSHQTHCRLLITPKVTVCALDLFSLQFTLNSFAVWRIPNEWQNRSDAFYQLEVD
jgi:hypothetical protein